MVLCGASAEGLFGRTYYTTNEACCSGHCWRTDWATELQHREHCLAVGVPYDVDEVVLQAMERGRIH